jgi:hypothetical protein
VAEQTEYRTHILVKVAKHQRKQNFQAYIPTNTDIVASNLGSLLKTRFLVIATHRNLTVKPRDCSRLVDGELVIVTHIKDSDFN